jgi:hypothetical protein
MAGVCSPRSYSQSIGVILLLHQGKIGKIAIPQSSWLGFLECPREDFAVWVSWVSYLMRASLLNPSHNLNPSHFFSGHNIDVFHTSMEPIHCLCRWLGGPTEPYNLHMYFSNASISNTSRICSFGLVGNLNHTSERQGWFQPTHLDTRRFPLPLLFGGGFRIASSPCVLPSLRNYSVGAECRRF